MPAVYSLLGGFGARLQLAHQLGCSVIALDYRDVGGSGGLLLAAEDMVDDVRAMPLAPAHPTPRVSRSRRVGARAAYRRRTVSASARHACVIPAGSPPIPFCFSGSRWGEQP